MEYLKVVDSKKNIKYSSTPKIYSINSDTSSTLVYRPYYKTVDLGLPSKILWADRNIGATSETDYGIYFQWGETTAYVGDDAKKHSYWLTSPINGGNNDYNTNAVSTWLGEHTTNYILKSDVDAAYVNIGSEWRMPTYNDFNELITNTTYTVETINGINVGKFTNKQDSTKYILLPIAGSLANGTFDLVGTESNYWTSSYNNNYSDYATSWSLNLTSYRTNIVINIIDSSFCLPIRCVYSI